MVGFKVNLTGLDILGTGYPFISIIAKSDEPKLVGHIDTSWNLFYTQSISVLLVVGKGRFVKSPNKKLKLLYYPSKLPPTKRLPDSAPFLKHLIPAAASSGLKGFLS